MTKAKPKAAAPLRVKKKFRQVHTNVCRRLTSRAAEIKRVAEALDAMIASLSHRDRILAANTILSMLEMKSEKPLQTLSSEKLGEILTLCTQAMVGKNPEMLEKTGHFVEALFSAGKARETQKRLGKSFTVFRL